MTAMTIVIMHLLCPLRRPNQTEQQKLFAVVHISIPAYSVFELMCMSIRKILANEDK